MSEPYGASPAMTHAMSALADYDLVQLHRLFLGRDPGSEAELADRRGRALDGLLREFVGSGEFRLNVQAPLREGRPPSTPARLLPASPTAGWAATALPMGDAERPRLADARTWPDLYAALFASPAFRREVEGTNPGAGSSAFAEACAGLAARLEGRAVIGALEAVERAEVLGWALDLNRRDDPPELELRFDGRPVARATPRLFRRELQDALGGAGRYGFAFDAAADGWPPPRPGTRVEVADARSGVVLGARVVDSGPEPGAIARFRADVAQAKAALAWLERRASELGAAATFALAEYGAWAQAYGVETFRAERDRGERERALADAPRFTLLVTPPDAPLDAPPLLDALARQELPGWEALLLCGPADAAALQAVVDGSDSEVRSRTRVHATAGAALGPELAAALAQAEGDHLLLLDGGDALAPEALHALASALGGPGAPAAAYGDDDVFEPGPDGAPLRSDPRLRGAFDADLLLGGEAAPAVLAVRRRDLERALAAGGSLAPERRGDLLLRLLEEAGTAGIVHTPGVIAHRRVGGPGDRAAQAAAGRLAGDVAGHLTRMGRAAAEPLADVLGAPVAGALRVVHPLPAGATATVVIPTRDRLELLRPCLESLEAHRAANRTAMAVTVVDNGSVEPDTLAYLKEAEASGRVRVLRSEAPFNFAAQNNLGFAGSDADLYVMLNNDMEVLTPGWLDALARHALRPEVGAVGARLVYEDLTIQHAGVVTGGMHELTAHEGVGVAGSDGGYMARHARTRRVSAVTGACLATRREVWTQLGGLDAARFAVDGNDVDYCLRAGEAGLAVIYTPDCTLIHHESKSRGFNAKSTAARERGEAETERLRARWGERLRADPFYNPLFDRAAKPFTRLGPPPPRAPLDGTGVSGRALTRTGAAAMRSALRPPVGS